MKKSSVVLAALFAAFAASASTARAQVAIYGMGSAGRLTGYSLTSTTGVGTVTNPNNGLWAYGGTFGLYDNFLRLGPLKLGTDIRGFAQTSNTGNATVTTTSTSSTVALPSATNHIRGGLIGLRLAGAAPLVPIKPYVQAEVGGASSNFGTTTDQFGFVYQVQGGADFTVFPHLDVRAEYGVGQFRGVNENGVSSTASTLQQLAGGVVLRF